MELANKNNMNEEKKERKSYILKPSQKSYKRPIMASG